LSKPPHWSDNALQIIDQTAAMLAAPLFPDGATEPLCCAQRFIACIDAGTAFRPWLPVAADRDDRVGAAFCNGGMTSSGVVSAISADAEYLLILRDLR
jgi:hypothetical protein